MRLSAPSNPSLDFPSPEAFLETLQQSLPSFGSIGWVRSTGSTNADLIQRAREPQRSHVHHHTTASLDSNFPSDPVVNPPKPWILGAHLQTAGKGRAGRPWANEAGSTLMFSCAFTHQIPPAQLPGIAPAIGVATCLALRAFISQQTLGTASPPSTLDSLRPLTLKWPNDLQWHDAKLAGLLLETAPASTVIVGMGLNLRGAEALSAHLDREIADLSQVQQQILNHAQPSAHAATSLHPAQLVAHIAQAWQHALDEYARHGYKAFTHSFAIVDALAGQAVQVMDQGQVLHRGIAHGTDALGRLRILTEAGEIPVLVGDVSIRPAHPLKGTP